MQIIRKKLLNKKVLYVICFMALNLLDVMRDFQFEYFQMGDRMIGLNQVLPGYRLGDIWLIVANCSGIFMAAITLSAYPVKKLFNKFNSIWTVICLAGMFLLPFLRTGRYGTILIQEELAIFNVWWIGVFAINLFKEVFIHKKMKIRMNVSFAMWTIITLFMVLSLAKAKVWPLWYYLMFTAFFVTKYEEKDYDALFNGMADGSIIAFIIMQTGAFFMRPFDDIRYQGMHTNWNLSALYYVIILVMCLYKLHILQLKKGKVGQKIYYLLIAGISLSLQFMTGCRTAWITTVLLVAIYGIFAVKKAWQCKWRQVFLKGIILIVSMLVTFVPVFMMARWLPTVLPVRMWSVGEYTDTESNVRVEEPVTSEKYTEIDEFLEYTVFRIWYTFFPVDENAGEIEAEDIVEKEDMAEVPVHVDSEKITNAKIPSWVVDPAMQQRFRVYSAYIHDMTWNGNGPDSDLAKNAYHAHNLWIQIGYFYGIPAGVVLIILSIVLIVRNFRQMIKNTQNPYVVGALLFTILFFCYGLTEVVWNTGQFILFLVFFVQYPHEKAET